LDAAARVLADSWCALLFAQDLLDPGDRLVDRLLGADAVGGDAVDGVAPDGLLRNLAVAPVARNDEIVVDTPGRGQCEGPSTPAS
jgi:hypothetical protein